MNLSHFYHCSKAGHSPGMPWPAATYVSDTDSAPMIARVILAGKSVGVILFLSNVY